MAFFFTSLRIRLKLDCGLLQFLFWSKAVTVNKTEENNSLFEKVFKDIIGKFANDLCRFYKNYSLLTLADFYDELNGVRPNASVRRADGSYADEPPKLIKRPLNYFSCTWEEKSKLSYQTDDDKCKKMANRSAERYMKHLAEKLDNLSFETKKLLGLLGVNSICRFTCGTYESFPDLEVQEDEKGLFGYIEFNPNSNKEVESSEEFNVKIIFRVNIVWENDFPNFEFSHYFQVIQTSSFAYIPEGKEITLARLREMISDQPI